MNSPPSVNYSLNKTKNFVEACYVTNTSNGPQWRNRSALSESLPHLLLQLLLVVTLDRILVLILKPLRQPRISAFVISGLLLGPSAFGRTTLAVQIVFPYKTTMVMETFANLALVYHMFFVGLEMDFSLIMNCGTQVFKVFSAAFLIPFGVGFGLYHLAMNKDDDFDNRGSLFWAIALTSTNFPDLARILVDLKLLRSNIGKIAMSSSIITDLFSWLLLIVTISIFNQNKLAAAFSTAVFVIICIFALRPLISWLIRRTSRGYEDVTDTHVWFILAGIMLCGLITDGCGSHSIVGAFMLGVIMPQEDILRRKVVEKLDDFVTGLLLPLFFLTSGLRTDVKFMVEKTSWKIICLVILLSCAAKVVSVLLVSLPYKMPFREGLSLGVLMNTKGVLALIILNTGRNIKALNNQSFPLMVLVLLVMSAITMPTVELLHRRAKIIKHNRTISKLEPNSEFQVLACLHSMRNVAGTLILLDLSHSQDDRSRLSIFAAHLLELSGRAASTAMLIVHEESASGNEHIRGKTETGQIINAFGTFAKRYNAVTVQVMTVVSPYTTMHMDICTLAEDKCVNLIILPFHKELKTDGRIGDGNSNFSELNKNVLINAPCSVGILMDRGLGFKRTEPQLGYSVKFVGQIAMLFIGGADDREALAYAWRIAVGHIEISLTVARFLPGKEATKPNPDNDQDTAKEKLVDDEFMEEIKSKSSTVNNIKFIEKVVNNGVETLEAIQAMGDGFAMYVIGRRSQGEESSPVTSGLSDDGLSDWGFPELGTIGDALGSSNFALHSSVLVVQQHVPKEVNDDSSESTAHLVNRDME